jgi:hypothetical protein
LPDYGRTTPAFGSFPGIQAGSGEVLGAQILSVYPIGLLDLDLIFDSVLARLYWVSAFFVFHFYCVLLLRASAVGSPRDARVRVSHRVG